MKPLRFSLRIVFYKDEANWIAHCLEFDLVGHGKTKKVALGMLAKAITIQFAASVKHDNPRNLFAPADGKFFEMFAAGKDVAVGKMKIEFAEAGMTLDQETREYRDTSANPVLA